MRLLWPCGRLIFCNCVSIYTRNGKIELWNLRVSFYIHIIKAFSKREGIIAAYRFIRTADVHYGSLLRSLALRDSELASLIGSATRRAFMRVVHLCFKDDVDVC